LLSPWGSRAGLRVDVALHTFSPAPPAGASFLQAGTKSLGLCLLFRVGGGHLNAETKIPVKVSRSWYVAHCDGSPSPSPFLPKEPKKPRCPPRRGFFLPGKQASCAGGHTLKGPRIRPRPCSGCLSPRLGELGSSWPRRLALFSVERRAQMAGGVK
jgi:hypothetical protein